MPPVPKRPGAPAPSVNGTTPAPQPETPEGVDPLKPFRWHGLLIDEGRGGEVITDCPFCGKQKLHINPQNGLWDCKVCASRGNPLEFVRKLYDISYKATTPTDYRSLCDMRGLLEPTTPLSWGLAKSVLTGEWLVPGYTIDGRIHTLYRYVRGGDGRYALWITPGLHERGKAHALHGVNLYNPKCQDVFVCEGAWDGMAWWEALANTKYVDVIGDIKELAPTGNIEKSLLSEAAVLAVPGANVFEGFWAKLLADKNVVLMYDNDHPGKNPKTGQPIEPVGWAAAKRVTQILASQENRPKQIALIRWGPGDTGYGADLKSGHDIRDHLNVGPTIRDRIPAIDNLFSRIGPVPEGWVAGRTKEAVKSGKMTLELVGCNQWSDLVKAGGEALEWTDGLGKSLAVMLSSILSTEAQGDQLWVKIIGPPSCGKSELCEAVSSNQTYVRALSTIKGFHSGYKLDKDGDQDVSLISQLRNMTLVTKDGDTLLTAGNLTEILAQARDIYDRVSRTHYRNNMGRDYVGINMTWILCGTESLRQLDSSELGERFLDCVVIDEMDEDLEWKIQLQVAKRARKDLGRVANGAAEDLENPQKTRFRQMTGGYINYLRLNAQRLLDSVQEAMPEWAEIRCAKLAQFVSFVRSRPSKVQEEKAQRELSFRLTSQMIRLANCLAVVMNKPHADEEVMHIVRQVALDTARGRVMNIVHELARVSDDVGLDTKSVALLTHQKEDKERDLLKFLRKIKVVDLFQRKLNTGAKSVPKWKLTPRLRKLYSEVFGLARSTNTAEPESRAVIQELLK